MYLLAAAAGLADITEELEGLLGGSAGKGRDRRGRVPRARARCDRGGVESPAVAALQDGDLQGAPSPPHLQWMQRQEITYVTAQTYRESTVARI